jgi:alpha-tubulin suppressor-like RCC1 family protein
MDSTAPGLYHPAMVDRPFVVLGLVALFGCTPRPSATLENSATATPQIRAPEQTGDKQPGESSKARWVDVSVESEFGCAVERTGAVYCWGRGPAAEMSLRELPPQPGPDPTAYGVRKWGPASRLELVDDARAVSTATGLACAIVDGGRVRCWGAFRWGTQHVYDVPGLAKAVALEISDGESCALLESGELSCWGAADFGIPHTRLAGTVAMSVSDSIACGLTQQGDVVCWGQGIEDWHRYDTQFNQQQPPSPFGTPADAGQHYPDSLEVGRFRGALDLALTGWNTLCVLRGDGKVMCSDRDVFAILRGEELGMREIEGANGIADLSATRSHSCARTLDERGLCWGRNVYGQLGDGSSITREQAAPVAQLSGVIDMSVAEDFSCALTRDDRIACWGFDRGEALAREDVHMHTVEGLRASSIAAAGHMTCAVDEAKQLRCWGSESIESIGIAGVATPSLVDISGGGEVLAFTSGWESCFLLTNGTLQCGTWTSYGPGSSAFVPATATPDVRAMVSSQPPACTITGAGRKTQLNCGQSFALLEPETRLKEPFDISATNMRACVAHSGGKVSCFAEFYYWGDGPRPDREFKPVPGISDAVAVSSGTYHDCALRKDGRVICWVGRTESEWSEDGRNATAVHYRMTDPVDMGLDQIVQLVSGSQHHCALSKAGAVRCWADSPYTEATVWQAVPTLSTDVVELAAGSEHTCARTKAGQVSCWGDDIWGQLGRVPSRVYLSPTTMKIE